MQRRLKSLQYIEDDIRIADSVAGKFYVKGSNDNEHTISFGSNNSDPSCTCRDWLQWHIPCKHFLAVFRLFPNWSWNQLPENYKKVLTSVQIQML